MKHKQQNMKSLQQKLNESSEGTLNAKLTTEQLKSWATSKGPWIPAKENIVSEFDLYAFEAIGDDVTEDDVKAAFVFTGKMVKDKYILIMSIYENTDSTYRIYINQIGEETDKTSISKGGYFEKSFKVKADLEEYLKAFNISSFSSGHHITK